MAFAAVTLAPSWAVAAGSLVGSLAGSSFFAGAVAPIERTLAFGLGASPPMLKTFGAPSFVMTGLFNSADPDEPSVGRFAMVGVCRGGCCVAAGAACGCCA